MIDISDLPNRLSTDKYRRDFDKHNAKVEKLYWQFAIMYLAHCLKAQEKPDADLISRTYRSTFFESEKLFYAILEKFNGLDTSEVYATIVSDSQKELLSEYNRYFWQILKAVQSFLKQSNIDFRYLDPESAEMIDLSIVDKRQPHLEPVSKNLKRLLDAGNYAYTDNMVFIDGKNNQIPRNLRMALNESAEKLMMADMALQAVQYLKDYLLLGQEYFSPYINVKGPNQAVTDAMGMDPKLNNEPLAKLNYHIRLKYRNHTGAQFKKESIAKALRRYFEE